MLAHTHVILAEMDTLNFRRNSDIDPIVDNKRHIVCLGDSMQLLGCLNHQPGLTRLISVLDECHS